MCFSNQALRLSLTSFTLPSLAILTYSKQTIARSNSNISPQSFWIIPEGVLPPSTELLQRYSSACATHCIPVGYVLPLLLQNRSLGSRGLGNYSTSRTEQALCNTCGPNTGKQEASMETHLLCPCSRRCNKSWSFGGSATHVSLTNVRSSESLLRLTGRAKEFQVGF